MQQPAYGGATLKLETTVIRVGGLMQRLVRPSPYSLLATPSACQRAKAMRFRTTSVRPSPLVVANSVGLGRSGAPMQYIKTSPCSA